MVIQDVQDRREKNSPSVMDLEGEGDIADEYGAHVL